MCQMKSLPLNSLIQYLYPDLYPIHTLEEQVKIDLKLKFVSNQILKEFFFSLKLIMRS